MDWQRGPLVTIVTPSYNQGEFIRATIESVLCQDYPHIEYIVMDGGSTDQTLSVLAGYAGRLTWVSEPDSGQAQAINKGFRRARGEIVAWLNSDDILLPGAVSAAVRAFEQAHCAGAIYGEGYRIDRDGRSLGRFPATEPFNLWKLVYLSDYILQQSVFFRRTALEQVGWLDETLHYALDWDLLIRIGKRHGLRYVPAFFGSLREYPEAKSFAGGLRRLEEIRLVLERHTGLKRAPGFWNYGLETYLRAWRAWLKHRCPRWLRPLAFIPDLFIDLAIETALMLIRRHTQGFYSDRWASNRVKWMLPAGQGDVIVRGSVPDDPCLRGQRLKVIVKNRELTCYPLQPGDFEFRFRAPEGDSSPFLFELRAERYKRPPLGSEKSFRRMAFILHSVEWAETAS